MNPDKVLLIDVSDLYDRNDHCNKRKVFDYPGAQRIEGWSPSTEQMAEFLDGLDALYTAETPYHWMLLEMARRRGVRSILHVNPEFCDHLQDPGLPAPTLFAAPTSWTYDLLPEPKAPLPVPVATERFTSKDRQPRSKVEVAHNFLHVAGRPAIYDRNGTVGVMHALPHIRAQVKVTIRCLQRGYVRALLRATGVKPPPNVDLVIAENNVDDYWDLYTGQDVLVMPRRFGGLCLPMQEAMGAGMPVILGTHDPYAGGMPAGWAASSQRTDRFMARSWIDVYTVDPVALAAKIDQFATDGQFATDARGQAMDWADQHSWGILKPEYDRVLGEVLSPG